MRTGKAGADGDGCGARRFPAHSTPSSSTFAGSPTVPLVQGSRAVLGSILSILVLSVIVVVPLLAPAGVGSF